MAANKLIFAFSIFMIGYFQCCVAQTSSTNINANADISNCSCDLTVNACDVNCCCDWECDQEDKDVFSTCVDQYTPPDTRVCVRKEIIIENNTDLEIEETDDGLFCVYRDNYEERNFYEVPQIIETEADFEKYRGDNVFGYRQEVISPTPGEFYKEGDVIYTVYETGTVGLLGQPGPLTEDNCKDTNPAGYLRSQQLECTRPLTSLAVDCMTSLPLDVATYYQGFRVIKTPDAFNTFPEIPQPPPTTSATTQSAITSTTQAAVTLPPDPLYNSSFALDVTPTVDHICIDLDGLNTTCTYNGTELPRPQYDQTTGVCSKAVVKVAYTLTQSGTSGITEVEAQFTFKDLVSDDLPILQAFSTTFPKVGESGVRSVSGKPGYVLGKPVRAGTITQNSDNNRLAINELQDLEAGITIVTSEANGQCSDSNTTQSSDRVPLTFGDNMRSGCFISASYDDLSSVCSLLQDLALSALKGPNLPTHVATFGNSSTEVTGDWVEILPQPDPSPPSSGDASCINMVTGMHWEILYSNVGAISNPQAKIIGVTYNYTQQDVRYQCYGQYCQPSTSSLTQRFEVVSSVQYIDASVPAVGETAERPSISARLPEDFFYPFS